MNISAELFNYVCLWVLPEKKSVVSRDIPLGIHSDNVVRPGTTLIGISSEFWLPITTLT